MSTKNSDKMANWPIPKLLFSMSLPAVFSMLIQAMYNVVDTIYISKLSQDALFAIGLSSPMYMIGLSISMGSALGISTLVSRRLGERKNDEANKIASTGFVLTIIHIVIVMCIGLLFGKPFLRIFTEREDIVTLGNQYLLIIMLCCFGQQFAIYFERLLQSQGNMIVPMFAQLLGAITNIILDPVFIFGFAFVPAMGMAGAAIATVIAQISSAIFCAIVYFAKNYEVNISLKNISFDFSRIKEIYAVGLPATVMNSIGSITSIMMNNVLVSFSEEAVSSLSLYFKVESFIFMPVFGFNQGALPVMAYNYGAKNAKRYADAVKIFVMVCLVIMTFGTILFKAAPEFILSFFEMNDALKDTACNAIKTISWSFIPASLTVVCSTVFQSFGKGVMSMIQQILRQIVFLIPVAYFLASYRNLALVWYAYPIAAGLTMLLVVPLAIKTYHSHFKEN